MIAVGWLDVLFACVLTSCLTFVLTVWITRQHAAAFLRSYGSQHVDADGRVHFNWVADLIRTGDASIEAVETGKLARAPGTPEGPGLLTCGHCEGAVDPDGAWVFCCYV